MNKIKLLTLFLALPVHAALADDWFLLSRHGDCLPLHSLERKLGPMTGVDSPQSFVAFVKAKGMTVSSTPLPDTDNRVFDIRVPDENLSLLFSNGALCRELRDSGKADIQNH